MTHYVNITETRVLLVEVEANDEQEAFEKVERAYAENEISVYNVKCQLDVDIFPIETSRVKDGFIKGYYKKDEFVKL